ncbi:glycoside hydrolase family 16 protein [Fibrobacter sp. UBA4309]|uniref:glycoside hydrolase family 16 protein n=1 Tax=Fibrobacter sp. UBA4309 TaxID=1946537 RepID=UPI0025C0DB74|nr:glycoside hydrolase family 16 protein [Fibrobacter sp. UBA4309]
MKTKYMLPTALAFVAAIAIGCSDDSTATAPEEQAEVPASSATIEPASSETIIQSSETIVLSSSSAGPVSYAYYGAELTGRDQFTYGRFEARMKMLSIPGSVSSMFLYYDPSYLLGKQPWNEIDIEVLGTTDTSWQANLITRYPNDTLENGTVKKNTKVTSESKHPFGFGATEDFHLFTLVWTPEYISWEIDSVEIRRDTLGMAKGQVEFMTQQQSLRFNVWASKSQAWVGKFTGDELADGPKIQYIDYVRVYKYDEATKSFTLDWQDDFDGDDLNDDHWSRGAWEMEKVMLRHENLIVKDGMAQLMLSREVE